MESKKFRINSAQFFLTYPKCELSPDEAHAAHSMLAEKSKYTIKDYVIAREKHEDGTNHLHMWFVTDRKLNIGSPHFFDIGDYHGSYEGVRSNKAVLKYVTKDGDYISSMS